MISLSENSMKVLQRRYLLKDAGGKIIESPDELFRRTAKSVAYAETFWGKHGDQKKWEEKFYHIMSTLLFLPNSPALMNAGTRNNQLSACFVLPVEDSMNAIFTTLKNAALIQQSGGGTGFNFSHLRPMNDLVSDTGGIASGPVSFMKIFNSATEYIKQGGKRRGANMGILDINHPDVEGFISSKKEKGVLTNFNISIAITNEFMSAVGRDSEWDLVHPNLNTCVKKVNARKLWMDIVENAWKTGDPGLIFIDTINGDNPTPGLGKIESTNPCGEVPLLPYESCNLGSINLSRVAKENGDINEIDWELLETVIHIAIRFLDDVIDVNKYIIPEIKEITLGNRKIGLGVMGWAELLIMLNIPYDSEDAIQLAEKIMQFIEIKSMEASMMLAEERGAFPNWDKSIYYPKTPIRNATRTSIAPTGTISIIADTSSSIEPLFALAFQRQHVLNGETLFSINPVFINYLKTHNLYSDKIKEQVIKEGIAGQIEELSQPVKHLFKTALEISPFRHLQHQLAFQKYTDNAVSKTINLPESATIDDVEKIYKSAWLQKAKGITIFRYHSKDKQVMHRGIKYGIKDCKVCIE
ncbi:MAG TPA: adenosylcobalamin-dependent ribonucleoside-diphosphate reductase [Chitinophagaceae bacterium]|nr:adenosylcobalamin-dependent ribonucleoside-diphosphate reductase [Chitinophagaceae bacterium]